MEEVSDVNTKDVQRVLLGKTHKCVGNMVVVSAVNTKDVQQLHLVQTHKCVQSMVVGGVVPKMDVTMLPMGTHDCVASTNIVRVVGNLYN
jgi:hypothetical protein